MKNDVGDDNDDDDVKQVPTESYGVILRAPGRLDYVLVLVRANFDGLVPDRVPANRPATLGSSVVFRWAQEAKRIRGVRRCNSNLRRIGRRQSRISAWARWPFR
jgi:hypothetical protein